MTSKAIVYVAMACDIIHHGHINIIKTAREYATEDGEVVVGLLTDEAIAGYKRIPHFNYTERKVVIENIKGVDNVIPQETLDYTDNLITLKPNYVVHGSDWREGPQKATRDKVMKALDEWNGKLIEPDYTKDISTTHILKHMK